MPYSLDKLTTAAECDAVITVAEKEKKDLSFRKTSLERQKENYAENSVEIDADLLATDAEITALQSVVNTLPPGDARDENEKRLKRLELKKFLLQQRDKDYGGVALLIREFDLERVTKELTEADAFIAAVTQRKAGL